MRHLLLRIAAISIGSLPFAILSVVGAAFLAHGTREPPPSPWVYVARVAELPGDGTPVRLAIQVPRRDAWCVRLDRLAGVVFLRRLAGGGVVALRPWHHGDLRVPVAYDPEERDFRSKCWGLRFDLDGREIAERRAAIGEFMQAAPARVVDGAVFLHSRD